MIPTPPAGSPTSNADNNLPRRMLPPLQPRTPEATIKPIPPRRADTISVDDDSGFSSPGHRYTDPHLAFPHASPNAGHPPLEAVSRHFLLAPLPDMAPLPQAMRPSGALLSSPRHTLKQRDQRSSSSEGSESHRCIRASRAVSAARAEHLGTDPEADSPQSLSENDEESLGFVPWRPLNPLPEAVQPGSNSSASNPNNARPALSTSHLHSSNISLQVSRRHSTLVDHLYGSDDDSEEDEGELVGGLPIKALLPDDHSDDDVITPSNENHIQIRRRTVTVLDQEGNPDTIDNITFVRQLGRGASGTVWHCIDESCDEERAVKVIPRKNCGRSRFASLAEVEAMKKLSHKNVVRLYECVDDPADSNVYLVLQYVSGGAVATMRDDGTCATLPLVEIAEVLQGVVSALVHCHRLGVVHGDIKPDNILVERADGKIKALLSDFGVALLFYKKPIEACDSVCFTTAKDFLRSVGEEGSAEQQTSGGMDDSVDSSDRIMSLAAGGPRTLGGTPAFLAPEVLMGHERTPPSDMWALGVTIFCLIFGRLPFDIPADATLPTLKRIVCESTPAFPPEATTSTRLRRWKALIKQLLQKDPEHRLTAVHFSRCKLLYPHAFKSLHSSNDFEEETQHTSTAAVRAPVKAPAVTYQRPNRTVSSSSSSPHAAQSTDLFCGELSMERIVMKSDSTLSSMFPRVESQSVLAAPNDESQAHSSSSRYVPRQTVSSSRDLPSSIGGLPPRQPLK